MPKVYIAISANKRHHSGMLGCLVWAQRQVLNEPAIIARIFRARPGEKNKRIVAEVTSEGVRMIRKGRYELITEDDRHG